MTTYLLFHIYDDDGGFGDAIPESKLLGVFATREQAEKVKSALENPHVYATPYADLWCGKMIIVEQEVVSDINAFIVETMKNAWWLKSSKEEEEEDDDDFEWEDMK